MLYIKIYGYIKLFLLLSLKIGCLIVNEFFNELVELGFLLLIKKIIYVFC